VAQPDSDEYELIVQEIVTQLSKRAQVDTTRIEHNVKVQGRATGNQIDVLWDFNDAEGKPRRIVFRGPVVQGHDRAGRPARLPLGGR
jgi:hypothetical protein